MQVIKTSPNGLTRETWTFRVTTTWADNSPVMVKLATYEREALPSLRHRVWRCEACWGYARGQRVAEFLPVAPPLTSEEVCNALLQALVIECPLLPPEPMATIQLA